jgi:hypothetical protein
MEKIYGVITVNMQSPDKTGNIELELATQLELVNDLNTSDSTKALTAEMGKVLNENKEDISNKGALNGYASLDNTGRVPASQLPSYVDDVLEFTNLSSFPATGETGKIYIALDTNLTYRWSGSVYVKIASSEVSSVAGKTGIVVLDKNDVALSSVDNTSDLNKPISTATQTALNLKEDSYKTPTPLAANYTFQLGDEKKIFVYDSVTAGNVFFEKNSVVAFPVGTKITIYNKSTGNLTPFFSFPATNINSISTTYLSVLIQGEKRIYTKIDTDSWISESDLGVTLATDAQTQLTSAITENNKVVSANKLFNWWTFQKGRYNQFSDLAATAFQKLGFTPLYVRANNNASDTLEDLRINVNSGNNRPFFERNILANATKGAGTWERTVNTILLSNTGVVQAGLGANTTVDLSLSGSSFTWGVNTLASRTGASISDLIINDKLLDIEDKTTSFFRVAMEFSYASGGSDGTVELSIVNPSNITIDQETESINIDNNGATSKTQTFRMMAVKTSDNNLGYVLRMTVGTKPITGWRIRSILRTNH